MPVRSNPRGFTLIEITVAVAILGLALTTLVGLQTRLLDTYYNERNRIQAAFYSQYLMTMLDVESQPPEPGTTQGSLRSALEDAHYYDADELSSGKDSLKNWDYIRRITSVDLPLFPDALRRIDLEISWGPSEDDSYSLVYFIASPAQQGQSSSSTSSYGSASTQ